MHRLASLRNDVAVRPAGVKGFGVFALRPFAPGEFIFRRRYGRLVTAAEIPTLSAEDRQHLCELDYDRSAVLLPPGSYLNHACDPNAMRKGVNVFAWHAIRRGEEITIDYRLNAFDGQVWACLCGTSECSGTIISDFFSLAPARQHAYLPYAPPFIRREYRRRAGATASTTPSSDRVPSGG